MALFNDMPCRKAVELMTDYLEDQLPAGQRAKFEKHLAKCPHCTEYLEQMRTTVRVLGQVDPPALDDATRASLVQLYQEWTSG